MKRKLVCAAIAGVLAASLSIGASAAAVGAEDYSAPDTAESVEEAEGTGFVPSITAKPAPETEDGTVTVNGKTIDIDDLSANGLYLEVTPLSDADDAPNDEITEALNDALEELSDANDTNIAFKSDEDAELFNEAAEAAKEEGKELVCSNIFDLSLLERGTDEIVEVGSITVTLRIGDADDAANLALVMHRDDGSWEVVDFIDNGDGTITLTLESLSPIAFFEARDAADSPDVPVGPGDDSGVDIIVPVPSSTKTPKDLKKGSSYKFEFAGGSAEAPAGDGAAAAAAGSTTATVASTANTAVASPATGTSDGSVFLITGILAALGGCAVIVKARRS